MLVMEIDLNNLEYNFNKIKEKTSKDIIAVIKNNAYGLGLIEIAKKLVSLNIKILAVNDIFEAVNLRKNFIECDILILNSLDLDDYVYLYKYDNLIISINSFTDAENLNKYYYGRAVRVHIHIDSGMNRLGIRSKGEYIDVLDLVKNNERFVIEGIYSHFVSGNKDLIDKQVLYFKSFLSEYDYENIHIMNSFAIKDCDFGNFVRVGISLYGILEDHKQVVRIKTTPMWVRVIKKGESIGYEQKYVANEDITVAMLPVGYGNGYLRSFEGFYCQANNQHYPIIGHICMNHMFILVDESITTDTEFFLTCEDLRIEELANFINTCPHQILCMFQIDNKKYI